MEQRIKNKEKNRTQRCQIVAKNKKIKRKRNTRTNRKKEDIKTVLPKSIFIPFRTPI
jgi:hypothetical protein